jgi:hypothetical protein
LKTLTNVDLKSNKKTDQEWVGLLGSYQTVRTPFSTVEFEGLYKIDFNIGCTLGCLVNSLQNLFYMRVIDDPILFSHHIQLGTTMVYFYNVGKTQLTFCYL